MSKPKPILALTEVLHLGMIDEKAFEKFESKKRKYFHKYHALFWDEKPYKEKRLLFRGEGPDEWIEPTLTKGTNIKALQKFLQDHGFMPGARLDGVFGYWTLASLRLFQEYCRTEVGSVKDRNGKKLPPIGIPDGRVFKTTLKYMEYWRHNKLQCKWGPNKVDPDNPKNYSWTKSTKEYDLWLKLLTKSQQHYANMLKKKKATGDDLKLFQLKDLEDYSKKTATKKVNEWSDKPEEIHLIGIRRKQEKRARTRGNDDLFVLLMNGLVFKFWGSTDPKPADSLDQEPYLIEGQHKYKLAWHKVSRSTRIYKALRPCAPGVLVYRDWGKNDALLEKDIRKGLAHNPTKKKKLNNPNTTINIHWTGDGLGNWSAGCQVISGRSYVNNEGKLIDCSSFSAAGYDTLSSVSKPRVLRNRGAYTFISDFILAYSKVKVGVEHDVLYTLWNDEAVQQFIDPKLKGILALQTQDILDQFKKEDEKGMIAGFVSQMKNSQDIKK